MFDEVALPPHMWSAAPRYVSIALTNACDLHCAHCYAPKYSARLATDRLQRWLAELDAHGCLGVGFGGGEPTLHPDFAVLCRYATTATDLAVTFTTHANRLEDSLLTELQGNVHFLRVSMDGVGRTYEEMRGRPFDHFARRLEAVSRSFPFGINVVVNARTITDLDAVSKCAEELGAEELLLLPERPTAAGVGADTATLEQMSRWIRAYRGRIALTVSEAAAASLPYFAPVPGETGMRAYVHVDAAGTLKATSFDDEGILIGDAGFIDAFAELNRRTAQGGS